MVDTLQMGSALQSFLKPVQLIFGSCEDNKKIIKKTFSNFKVKKFIFNFKEAELIKISINLYLFFSVSFANILEKMARQNGIEFSKITNVLRNDKRIGMHAYINPSLGMSGGHLERDSFFFNKLNKDTVSSQILRSNREIYISLPASYQKSPKKSYPLLLLLDGDYLLEPFQGALHYGAYWDDLPEFIVVELC